MSLTTEEFIVQQQGPDEPIFILGPEPQNRFIARMEEGTMEETHLLAAAPDLLVALEQCVPLIVAHANSSGEGVSTLQVARQAIAKAKGKTT